ncbi:hypothetical protein CC78DRAFT_542762 [Lojkania enalia]|uniref:Cellular morphogenesis protein n=1 Tax=Lojkania enalia TaxID=147567 RepID=A0A9P4N1G1_9PLEO|nr:hypothetical protein CC78DRAFT_542762 [Didymosphaeria enalia]
MLNPDDGTVTPLVGLNGSVNALFCDDETGQVYVGGLFDSDNSTNAIVWATDWTDMPFSGFNGAVNSIIKAPNGKIIFGGEFNALGGNSSAPRENNTQVLPIGSANLTAQTSSGRPGLSDPKSIVCKSDPDSQGPGSTWLLADNSPGFWKADFGFGFIPTKLRLHNTNFEGRGTRTFRYTALPDTGIMNLSYVNPDGQRSYCSSQCPLPEGNTTGQDFEFVNRVGMNSFRIDISDWYGPGGGLNGIELFQDDIFAYAIDDFNEPKCGGVTTGALSRATPTEAWVVTPSHNSHSQYLTAQLQGDQIDPTRSFVVFEPDIPQSGNYTIDIYTPGCQGDNTCNNRGRVNITGSMSRSGSASKPISTELFQTNLFDKYDLIYDGYIDATDGFRPSVTLAPSAGQTGGQAGGPVLTVVAQRIRFTLKTPASGQLNGIFEYDPSRQVVEEDFTESVYDSAGASLSPRDGAIITSLANDSERLFVGGNFSGDGFSNIFAINATNPVSLPGEGLDNQVMTFYENGTTLYIGGNFTQTRNGETRDLNGVAAFSMSDNRWSALGAGVNGVVVHIVPFTLNISNTPEPVLGISGFFDQVNAFQDNKAFSVQNFAIWVPSRNNWYENLDVRGISIQGILTAHTDIPGSDPLFAGSIDSQSLGASGAVSLQQNLTLSPMSVDIHALQQQQGSLQKRATTDGRNENTTGVVAATFYKQGDTLKAILGGHFAATGQDGQNLTNLVIVDVDGDQVNGLRTGIDTNSTFKALGVLGTALYAGGSISGTINNNEITGIMAYDLESNDFASSQPPALQGPNVTVNAIAPRPESRDVYVAGRFQSAGSLSCPALCIWNTERNQWTTPGSGLTGVVSSMLWISNSRAVIAGNLTINGNQTKIVTYDSSNTESPFQQFTGAQGLPGPVRAICNAVQDGSQIWASGQAGDGSTFLQRFNGNAWLPVNNLFGENTEIRSIQVLSLSENHDNTDLIARGEDLLILGNINITNFGTASGALFNGTTLQPFLLSTTSDNTPGSLSQIFLENPFTFPGSGGGHMHKGFIVLIALGIALGLTFLLVVAGILIEWYRKKSKGYMPAPTSYPDRGSNMSRLPPEQLLGTLSGNRAPAI